MESEKVIRDGRHKVYITLRKSMVVNCEEVYITLDKNREIIKCGMVRDGVRVNLKNTKYILEFMCKDKMNYSLRELQKLESYARSVEVKYKRADECDINLDDMKSIARVFHSAMVSDKFKVEASMTA